jgi:hypothetical protein
LWPRSSWRIRVRARQRVATGGILPHVATGQVDRWLCEVDDRWWIAISLSSTCPAFPVAHKSDLCRCCVCWQERCHVPAAERPDHGPRAVLQPWPQVLHGHSVQCSQCTGCSGYSALDTVQWIQRTPLQTLLPRALFISCLPQPPGTLYTVQYSVQCADESPPGGGWWLGAPSALQLGASLPLGASGSPAPRRTFSASRCSLRHVVL